jgi:hypothetical protein
LTAHIGIGLLPDKGQSSLHRRNQPFPPYCNATRNDAAQHFGNAIARPAISPKGISPSQEIGDSPPGIARPSHLLNEAENIILPGDQAALNKGLSTSQRRLPLQASYFG